jgi:hypothetical protein
MIQTENDLEFDNKLKTLSGGAYLKKGKIYTDDKHIKEKKYFENYTRWDDEYKNENNVEFLDTTVEKAGFYANVYRVDDKLVIVFRGTNDFKDVGADAKMVFRSLSSQHREAVNYFEYIVNKYKDSYGDDNVVLTGHSLGGSLAQYVAYKNNVKAVTFCAYGIKNSLPRYENDDTKLALADKNIKNYGNNRDPIFMSNIKNQIGQNLVIKDDHKFYKDGIKSRHSIPNMGDLKDGEPYNPKIHKLIGGIENKDLDRIIVTEEIKELVGKQDTYFTDDDLKYIAQQQRLGNVMSMEEAERKVASGEVHVRSYTKDDGTYVRSYYRSRPSF